MYIARSQGARGNIVEVVEEKMIKLITSFLIITRDRGDTRINCRTVALGKTFFVDRPRTGLVNTKLFPESYSSSAILR